MFQPDQQHRDICGTDTGNSAGLTDGHGADGFQLFPGLQPQTADGCVVDVSGQQTGLFLLKFSHLLFLTGEVAGVLDLDLHFLGDGRGQRPAVGIEGGNVCVGHLRSAEQISKAGGIGNRGRISGFQHGVQGIGGRNAVAFQPIDFLAHQFGNQTNLGTDVGQTLVGIVLPVEQPVFGAAGHDPVRLFRALGHQIVNQRADIAGVPGQDQGVFSLQFQATQ